MMDDIGGYRVDKVKFAIELTPEEAVDWKRDFVNVMGDNVGPQGGRVYNVVSVKKGEVAGTFLFIFDVWGDAAINVDLLDFGRWYPHISRVDLKIGMPMTAEGQRNYYDFLRDLLKGKRSLDLRESPIRQKRGDRDAGGYSLTLGAHKSDYRVHWTLRGREDGYQEFQLAGSRLDNAIGATRHYIAHPGLKDARISWEGIMQALLISAQVELADIDGLYDTDRAAILAGSIAVHGVMERKLERIERDIDRLPWDACFALLVALERKVFGEQPAPKYTVTGDDILESMEDGEE